jgi:hypothetical protein
VSPVKYEKGFISQKTTFFIVTAVKTSNLTTIIMLISFMIFRKLTNDRAVFKSPESQFRPSFIYTPQFLVSILRS